jgi:hypothetical protein
MSISVSLHKSVESAARMGCAARALVPEMRVLRLTSAAVPDTLGPSWPREISQRHPAAQGTRTAGNAAIVGRGGRAYWTTGGLETDRRRRRSLPENGIAIVSLTRSIGPSVGQSIRASVSPPAQLAAAAT